jgi:hypothetical protein
MTEYGGRNDFLMEFIRIDVRAGLGRGFKSFHPVHFLLRGNYRIKLSLFQEVVRQNSRH